MISCRNILCLLCFFVFLSLKGFSQDLRIDFDRINNEKARQKTNGEYLGYLEKEIQKLIHSYGKSSKEYIFLQGYYLGEYHRVYQPYATLNPISIKEYTEGRKELVELTKKVYGDTSWVYADAILSHGMNYTNTWNQSMEDSTFQDLLSLTNTAINITFSTQAFNDETRFSYQSMLYVQKGDLFRKIGKLDSAIMYYDIVLKIKEEHPLYDDFFPSFLGMYANVIGNENGEKGLDFLIGYEPIIKEKYKAKKDKIYYFLKSILSHYLKSNYINKAVLSDLMLADTLCMDMYGEISKEYVYYVLDYKLPSFKKMGWKSLVYQVLVDLNNYTFKRNEKLLAQDEYVFYKYHLEWFYYYQSINEEQNGITYLKWVEENDIDTNINRPSFASKISVYRELSKYFRFKKIDSCFFYSLKVLDLEEAAKKKWGDYVVHQYHEIAKLFVNTEDSTIATRGYQYSLLALNEFNNAYGKESDYFKSAQFTLGRLKFITSHGKRGLSEMWPNVYSNLNNSTFVPPLNTSVFQTYGDILNKINMPDSADYFYRQIFYRNSSAQLFRVLGSSSVYQIKSLQDIYTQNYFILTQHFQRFKINNYRFVSAELAELLFKKNLIYQIQAYTNEAMNNTLPEQDKWMLQRIEKDKKTYDSLLYSGSMDIRFIDSAYEGLDLDKNWLLQSYIANNAKDSSKLVRLRQEYTYREIQRNLVEGECFIDIVRFLLNDKELGFSLEPYYAIVLIDKESSNKLEYFFVEDGLNFENLVQAGDIDQVSSILSPLIANLKNYKRIYVNPDGAFNLLSFYSLKDKNDDYLIKDKIFIYINTIDGVIEPVNRPQNTRTATFFGNPLFRSKAVANSVDLRNAIFPIHSINNFKELPYSKIEIETASKCLGKNGWQTKQFVGEQCTEDKLKNEPAPDILHIASHGFYISESDSTKINFAIKSNPYLRSGLVLGTVNINGKNLNDNLLTAYEVMNLNLNNTSLVVLSACESARGELKSGQGVYGIQRAFKIAGAKNVLVSVRSVDDKATQLLMEYFYINVSSGDDYPDALRKAQLKMINHPLFNDPKYWDSFILIGQ